eukprot:14991420-Alexandrium_andersonii.AAC.1
MVVGPSYRAGGGTRPCAPHSLASLPPSAFADLRRRCFSLQAWLQSPSPPPDLVPLDLPPWQGDGEAP